VRDCGNAGTVTVSKRAILKIFSSIRAFRSFGPFYIGICNEEVVSGYVLDAPPDGVSIWRFILPAYDRIEFLHMGLGKRIAEFFDADRAPVSSELELMLKNDWETFSKAQDARSLVHYLDSEKVDGDYCEWAKFLTCVRLGELEIASTYETQWRHSPHFPRVQLIEHNLKLVHEAKERTGWNGVQELLSDWSKQTVEKFCGQRI